MTFTSFTFLIFFPLVVLLYNIVPSKWKNIFLLIVSYFYYINIQPIYVLLLLGVTIVTYFFAKKIQQTEDDKPRQCWLIWGIITVIAPLFFFKYFGAINDSIGYILSQCGLDCNFPKMNYLLPVGISYYTFMAIGYLVDVHNEEIEYERSFINTSLFLSFFPIILSGPIERSKNMFSQFHNLKNSTHDDVTLGFKMMLWGYFMKLCVADRLGLYVSAVFNNLEMHNGSSILLATLLFPIQEYGDLGGYSLIAMGVANCIGIRIVPNFRRPFFATSMSELWRRWHMSLIHWITDYIYTPIAFALRKWKTWGIITALMSAFLISGLWHGATIPFILWGLMQGLFLSIEAVTNKWRSGKERKFNLTNKWWYSFSCMAVVFILFAFSEIFGRGMSFNESALAVEKIFTGELGTLFIDKTTFAYASLSIIILFIKDYIDEFHHDVAFLNSKNTFISASVSALLAIYIILFGVLDGGQFIYFQF